MPGDMEKKERQSSNSPQAPVLPVTNPESEKPAPAKSGLHPAFYIATWIALSSSVILFNKWILSTKKFEFPISLTTWHLAFATLMTQLLARFTTVLDSRKKVPMTGRIYLRAIVPIGLMFSLSLICGNLTYLYLSVSFIQMLKATTPVAVLIATWSLGLAPPSFKTLGNVSFIVLGVIIASAAEIQFNTLGVIFQMGGIVFEALRLTMVQRLLSSAEFKMDPLVSLYYFAPACAVMNGVTALVAEAHKMSLADLQNVGYFNLVANAFVAFALNVSVVFLIGKTSSLVMTLSGVLKDIMLVVASMLIFRDPVTHLQFFGYSIALAGLVYYRLGVDKFKEMFTESSKQWSDYGNRSPLMRKLLSIFLVIFTLVILLGGIGSAFPEYAGKVKDAVSNYGQ